MFLETPPTASHEPEVMCQPRCDNRRVEHTEWQSDAPASDEEAAQPWVPPDWMVYLVIAGFVVYLLIGLAFAIYDAATGTQSSGSMAVLSFFLEIVVWPAKLLIPLVQ